MDLKGLIRLLYYKFYACPKSERNHKCVEERIRNKGYANVVFLASNVSMWRYQGIYDLLSKDDRFRTFIILCPLKTYSKEQKSLNIKELREFFDKKGISYIDATAFKEDEYDIHNSLHPDIMFYTHPYGNEYGNALDSRYYEDCLLCYAPYGVRTISAIWSECNRFQNIAWKLFYETTVNYQYAKEHTYCKGKNVIVVGDPSADDFLRNSHTDVWKVQPKRKKRIIWAPHYTIEESQYLQRGSFLWLCDFMLELAELYSGFVQIAFKPHPRLKTVLYNLHGWGKERTDEYYNKWASLPNTQFEDADFIDLFMTSDAMIHDSGSFTAEYHYSLKPVLFSTQKLEEVREPLNQFGRDALDVHYIGKNVKEIKEFIDKVVIEGHDTMLSERQKFYNKYLLPPNGLSVSENIYQSIINTIWKTK